MVWPELDYTQNCDDGEQAKDRPPALFAIKYHTHASQRAKRTNADANIEPPFWQSQHAEILLQLGAAKAAK